MASVMGEAARKKCYSMNGVELDSLLFSDFVMHAANLQKVDINLAFPMPNTVLAAL
jgi:hypothetical protein